MCGSKELFTELQPLNEMEVTLGDGHSLKVIGQGVVELVMNLPNGRLKTCKLLDMLYVLKLTYNLMSMSKAAENGKVTEFDEDSCKLSESKCCCQSN